MLYFPFDTDFFGNRKIKALRGKFGSDGVLFYLYILCEIYRDKGYYLIKEDDFNEIAASEIGCTSDKISLMLAYLLTRSMLKSIPIGSVTALTSDGIQRRYQYAIKGRAQKRDVEVNGDLWLLEPTETESFIKVRGKMAITKKNESFSEKNPDKSRKNSAKEEKRRIDKIISCYARAREAFEEIKKPTESDLEQLNSLCERFGEQAVISAISDAIKKGGRSIGYVRAILEGGGGKKNTGRYPPTYDRDEAEKLMDEWSE